MAIKGDKLTQWNNKIITIFKCIRTPFLNICKIFFLFLLTDQPTHLNHMRDDYKK